MALSRPLRISFLSTLELGGSPRRLFHVAKSATSGSSPGKSAEALLSECTMSRCLDQDTPRTYPPVHAVSSRDTAFTLANPDGLRMLMSSGVQAHYGAIAVVVHTARIHTGLAQGTSRMSRDRPRMFRLLAHPGIELINR